MELIREVLDAMGIVSLSREGFGQTIFSRRTCAVPAPVTWRETRLGDRDSFQTATDNVTVLCPGTGPGDLHDSRSGGGEGTARRRAIEIAAIVGGGPRTTVRRSGVG